MISNTIISDKRTPEQIKRLIHSGDKVHIEMTPFKSSTGMYMVINVNEDMFYIGWLDDSLDCYTKWKNKDLDISELDGDLFLFKHSKK